MLDGQKNGWLSAAIIRLRLASRISLSRFCRLLSGKLPMLCELYVGSTFGIHRESPSKLFVQSSRPFLMLYDGLGIVDLGDVKFFSLSALVHILGDIANLEVLMITHLTWVHPPGAERPPARMSLSSFRRLRRIVCPCGWALIWLFAPLLARRCANPSEDAISRNSDIRLLSMLIEHCAEYTTVICTCQNISSNIGVLY